MQNVERIRKHLIRNFEGRPWYGEPIPQALDGLSAAQAAARPIENAHTIWEILLHMIAWKEFALRGVRGEKAEPLTGRADWPAVGDASEAAWRAALARLVEINRDLCAALENFPEERLTETVPGLGYPFSFMLHGVIQHDLYHAGQLGLLRKAVM